jgi:hypothetical protein
MIRFDAIIHEEHPKKSACPVCLAQAEFFRRKNEDIWEGWCPACGDVRITQGGVDEASRQSERHLISTWLRTRASVQATTIVQAEEIANAPRLIPKLSVLEKLDLALTKIAEMTRVPGEKAAFDIAHDFPLIHAVNANEAGFYIKELKALAYLDPQHGSPRIISKGYQRLAEIQQSGRQSNLAFIAMWFDPQVDALYDRAIEPAVRAARYKPLRIDKYPHVNRIDDEIVAQIRRSRFMVADFTGQRPGVYFEAGLMVGLGRRVMWMCSRQELKEIHFDTRQYSFIVYDSIEDARMQLEYKILALEGEGLGTV